MSISDHHAAAPPSHPSRTYIPQVGVFVLLLLVAVALRVSAAPECLPECEGADLYRADLRGAFIGAANLRAPTWYSPSLHGPTFTAPT